MPSPRRWSGARSTRCASPSASRSPTGAARPTAGCWTQCAGHGAPASWSTSASTSACVCGRRAEDEAVRVFAANLRDLLLAAPAGTRPTMGLDPGFRTGVKVAVVDATGKVVATETIYPHVPQRRWDEAIATLARLARTHRVELIAIGNGTASRETDKLGGRTDPAACRPRADQGHGVRGGCFGVLRVGLRRRRNCPSWTSRCAARYPSRGACRIRSPSS